MSARAFLHSLVPPLVLLAASPSAAIAQSSAPRTFTFGCASLALDLRSNQSVCTMVEISDGSIEISADRGAASETNFESSEWEFTGNVRIALETAVLTADEAVFRFASNELVFGELSGMPVELRDVVEEQATTITGTADRVTYDNQEGTARMEGQARLARGENEYLGCDMIYNLNEKTLDLGSPDCRVQLRIFPPEAENGEVGEPAEAP